MRKARENIIVAQGNYPLFPKDVAVFSDTGEINVLPGQIAFWDPITRKGLGTGIKVSDYDRINIGVGIDTNGDGMADQLRMVFGDQLFGCHINALTAQPPVCGHNQIKDLIFGDCMKCGENLGINISVEDDFTQNTFPHPNRTAVYTFTTPTGECDCEDCAPEYNCEQAVDALIQNINGAKLADVTKTTSMGRGRGKRPKLPFTAHKLYAKSIDYCITPVANDCKDCIEIAAITGVRFGGTTITFDRTTSPNDATKTLTAQLGRVVKLIDKALDGAGKAALAKGTGACCPSRLQVNTSHVDFALLGTNGAAITRCATVDALPADKCGIRIIWDSVDLPCNCYVPNPKISFLGRKGDVFPASGFYSGTAEVVNVQDMKLPENTGYDWQYRDYQSDNGGRGRNHNNWNDSYGAIGLPGENDRATATKVVCKESYCSFNMEHNLPAHGLGVSSPHNYTRGRSIVLIPGKDTTTLNEFTAVLNSYVTSAGCPVKKAVYCLDPDDATKFIEQHKIENTATTSRFPDSNGSIL